MKKNFLLIALILLIVGTFSFFIFQKNFQTFISPLGSDSMKPKPLLLYSFENLKQTTFLPNQITLGSIISETPDIISQQFYFSVPEKPGSSSLLRVSGLLHRPNKNGTFPVIIMFRGYAPKETFRSGSGTSPSAREFSKNGFITFAPDFLGYGDSASPSADPFEERFQTYTTALSLLASIKTVNRGLDASYSGRIRADTGRIGLWGHSNGGHIALAALSISGLDYPTVLWAPVSKSFPYSILYYTDETDDQGKALRRALNMFEADYDTEQFSPVRYYHWIRAPIEIHQGTDDKEVPVWWSDELAAGLKKEKIPVTYITYPGSDHNFLPDGWSHAVSNSISFYNRYFQKP